MLKKEELSRLREKLAANQKHVGNLQEILRDSIKMEKEAKAPKHENRGDSDQGNTDPTQDLAGETNHKLTDRLQENQTPSKKDLQVTEASAECIEDVLQQEPTTVRDANICDSQQATEFEAPKDYDVQEGAER